MRRLIRKLVDDRGLATSLIEATLVITIAAVLSSVALTFVEDHTADAQLNNAQAEVKLIGISVLGFIQDTGFAPLFRSGLQTGPNDPIYSVLETTGSEPSDLTGTWSTDPNGRDQVYNHLVGNLPGSLTPGYRRVGEFAYARFKGWNGPYISKLPPSDPWGDKYLVNIGLMQRTLAQNEFAAGRRLAVFVISAGPDRAIQTRFEQFADAFVAGGDDVIFRIQ
jgi:type II secretory pathway pseudopilin PulG